MRRTRIQESKACTNVVMRINIMKINVYLVILGIIKK